MQLVPVDHDPFAAPAGPAQGYRLEPVDHDPFAAPAPTAPAAPAPAARQMPVYDAMGNVTGYEEAAPAPNQMPYGEQMRRVGTVADDAVRMMANGATLGVADKFAAGMTPGNFDTNLAAERGRTAAVEAANPGMAGAGRAVGGAMGVGALAAAGLPVFGGTGGLMARTGKAAASMFGFGGAMGALGSDSTGADRAIDAGKGGLLQAGVGAAGPLGGAALLGAGRMVARPFLGMAAPESWAAQQFTKALGRSGQSADDLGAALAAAKAEQQPMFTAADALGPAGQRGLRQVVTAPGAGSQQTAEFLASRQAGQGERMGQFLREGFDAPVTAEARAAALTAERKSAADVAYGEARKDAGAVNTTPVIAKIDERLNPGASALLKPEPNVSPTAIEEALAKARRMLTDDHSQVVNFSKLLDHKQALDDMASAAGRAGRNKEATAIGRVADQLDQRLVEASPTYAGARNAFVAKSREIDAVGTGQQAAKGGRAEDVAAGFRALAPNEQAAYRHGFADPYLAKIEGAAEGANKARQFTSDRTKALFPEVAGAERGGTLMNQIGRENTMHRTLAEATGGSKTTDKLFDAADGSGMDVGTLISALQHPGGLLKTGLAAVSRAASGSTEAGRQALAKMLLEVDAGSVTSRASSLAEAEKRRQLLASILSRGTANAAVAASR